MKKPLSLFLALAFGIILTVPAFADILYADTGGNYTVVTDATLNGELRRAVYGNVAAVRENRSSAEQSDASGNSAAWHIVKADSSGYHSVSDWYQDIGGFCQAGFAAAKNFDGKWGVLNAEGQVALDFKFDSIYDLTDDGYVLIPSDDGGRAVGRAVLNLKTGKEVMRNSRENTGKPPDETWDEFIIEPIGGCNNGLIPVQVTVMKVVVRQEGNHTIESHSQSERYCQYFGLDGKPAFPSKFNSISNFQNGYGVVTERVRHPADENPDILVSNEYTSIIDTHGNVILSDHGSHRAYERDTTGTEYMWKDEWRSGWHEGDFVLKYAKVGENGIIVAGFPKDKISYWTDNSKYIDLTGNVISSLSEFKIRSGVHTGFHNGYAATFTQSGYIVCDQLVDADGTVFFSFKPNNSASPSLSDVSNTGFCWAFEKSWDGKEDMTFGKDRILGVIQVPVKETPTPEPTPAPVQSGQFEDVSPDAYYADAVTWAVDKGVTNGVSETNFAPADTCTRGQVATFLWRANGKPEPVTTENPFTDVDPSSAFYKAILWAAENGITAGTSDTTFSPGNPCTRAHVVTFLWRAQGKPAPSGDGSLADSFPQGYYTDAVRWADAAGLLDGTGEAFTPSALCPRADIVTYLYRNLA